MGCGKNSREDRASGSVCPVCCALVRTMRACPFQLPFKCVCACQMDSLRTRGWVLYVPVCLAAQHCSGWRDSHALSHTADFTRSHGLSCLRLQPSLCRSPVTPLHPSSSLIPSSAPLSAFPSPRCPHSLILEPIDLQSEWANRARADILQCDLGACKTRGEGGKKVGVWEIKYGKRKGWARNPKLKWCMRVSLGKREPKKHTDWPAQCSRPLSRTFLITNLTGMDQRDET